MNYQTFAPHKDLSDFIKCYWMLEVPAEPNPKKQQAFVDGYVESGITDVCERMKTLSIKLIFKSKEIINNNGKATFIS